MEKSSINPDDCDCYQSNERTKCLRLVQCSPLVHLFHQKNPLRTILLPCHGGLDPPLEEPRAGEESRTDSRRSIRVAVEAASLPPVAGGAPPRRHPCHAPLGPVRAAAPPADERALVVGAKVRELGAGLLFAKRKM